MQQSIKMRTTLVAGAALIAAGAFTMAMGEEKAAGPTTVPIVSSGEMTLGDTATTTTPPTVAPVAIATPAEKATVPCGFTKGC
ncbi:hypothetical protein [Mycobacterium sp. 3519A]|uniref:hypothetical protein n=1 Tax=Mycobacterium sp. 3519A TaxID=2057184 RepID=UPI000C7B6E17|nr:hypothetical protein [Mycobacterium sp. 3519A]